MSRHPDRLSLLGMRFTARHGVLPHEKVEPQRFEIDVVLHADLTTASASDDLGDTIDYAALYDLVAAIAGGPSFDLIEGLAGAIARASLAATDPLLVGAVEVRVRKPQAPLDGELQTVEAAIVRHRADASAS
jgi:dihydroneopterin aldolase